MFSYFMWILFFSDLRQKSRQKHSRTWFVCNRCSCRPCCPRTALCCNCHTLLSTIWHIAGRLVDFMACWRGLRKYCYFILKKTIQTFLKKEMRRWSKNDLFFCELHMDSFGFVKGNEWDNISLQKYRIWFPWIPIMNLISHTSEIHLFQRK